jgi:hypothetical protein
VSTTKQRKLDIFALLNGLSKKDIKAYTSLSEDEKKEVMPLVVMRWMSGTSDARQVYFLNELVNPFIFPFYKHKELLVALLSICGPGQSRRYNWNKSLSKKKGSSPVASAVVKEYFGYNTVDANDAIALLSTDDIMDYAQQLGYQSDEITKLKKELKGK